MAYATDDRERWKGGVAAIALQLAIGYALVTGLGTGFVQARDQALAVFDVMPPPPPPDTRPPPPPPAPTDAAPREEGRAAPPNLRATPKEVVAPPPIVPLPVPPPIIAPPIASTGNEARAGAADRPGPGTGAGGIGDGLGSGRRGSGTGGGGRGLGETGPRQIRGSIADHDFPDTEGLPPGELTISVLILVEPDGRVGDCEIDRSSGNRRFDDHTCTLIQRRFRYRPGLDAVGRPITTVVRDTHSWFIEDLPPEPGDRRRRRRDW